MRIMGILDKSRDRCSICGSKITFPYRLDRYGIPGFVCGRCYDERLREIYGIDLSIRREESKKQGLG
ncbi:hypothetical protein HRbin04_01133 [archaeon HR04]|nr:hypothetical protein HRbin04_01133 [archaeon HR04]